MNIKAKKGQIQVLVNPLTKQFELIDPANLVVYVDKVGTKKIGVIVSEHEEKVTQVIKNYEALKEEYLKFKDEALKNQSDNLMLFNKMNNTIDTLVKKVNALENEVATLLSMKE